MKVNIIFSGYDTDNIELVAGELNFYSSSGYEQRRNLDDFAIHPGNYSWDLYWISRVETKDIQGVC